MSKKDVHITPRAEGGWSVRREGAARASSNHDPQAAAVAAARSVARRDKVKFTLHGKDGRIRSKDSYDDDPYPPKG